MKETGKRRTRYTGFKLQRLRYLSSFIEQIVPGIGIHVPWSMAPLVHDQSITALFDEFTWGFQMLFSAVLTLEAATHHLALTTKLKPVCTPRIHHTAFIHSSGALCILV